MSSCRCSLAKQSPKEYVFLQTETYLKFGYEMAPVPEGAEGEDAIPHEMVAVDAQNEAPAQVIFGLRPCDARGFVQMDRVMGGYGGFYYDPLYNARREATTLVAVTCAEPRSTCFCTAIGGCPAGHEGVDVLCTRAEGGCVVESFTEKGEALLAAAVANGAALADATDAQKAQADETKMLAITKVDVPFDLDGVRDALHDNIEDKRWVDLSMRCISCGTCTYVCPSCYCFSVNDSIIETKGERYRCWDNCFNPQYTEETSGHNARGPEGQALPQPLQPQVLVLPRQVRQPALLGLRPLHRALPDAHRHPRSGAGDGRQRGRAEGRAGAGVRCGYDCR